MRDLTISSATLGRTRGRDATPKLGLLCTVEGSEDQVPNDLPLRALQRFGEPFQPATCLGGKVEVDAFERSTHDETLDGLFEDVK